jgi:hypothetical protein
LEQGITVLSNKRQELVDLRLRGRIAEKSPECDSIPKRRIRERAPMSPAQERMWLRSTASPAAGPFLNEVITIHHRGELNHQVLESCFVEILRRHEAWRTSFAIIDGVPTQMIHEPPVAWEIPIVDLRGIEVDRRNAEAARLISEAAEQPFDTQNGPLVRTLLLEADTDDARLAIIAHPCIVDGVSAYQILPTELSLLYAAFSEGRPSPIAELAIQFGDYCDWQRRTLTDPVRASQYEFWKGQLAEAFPALPWRSLSPKNDHANNRRAIVPFALPEGLSERLEQFCREAGVTLFTVLLAGFVALLHFDTGERDVVVGTLSSSGRKRSETQDLLGYFLNPVALRFGLTRADTFRTLLSQAKVAVSGAISNDDVPFEDLLGKMGLIEDGVSPVRLAMSLQPDTPPLVLDWTVTTMDSEEAGTMQWDFYVAFIRHRQELIGRAQFNPRAFDEGTVDCILSDLWRVLDRAMSNPGVSLHDLKHGDGQEC